METLSIRVPTDLKERIEAHAEEIGETKSLATRKLIERGLEADEQPTVINPSILLIWAGTILVATQVELTMQTLTGDAIALLGILLAILGALLDRTNPLKKIRTARHNGDD